VALLASPSLKAQEAPRIRESGSDNQQVFSQSKTLAPALFDAARPAAETVPVFLDWISRIGPADHETARNLIHDAAFNPQVAQRLGEEALATYSTDHSRSLVSLSVLGELRNATGEEYLRRFVHLPLPTTGTMLEGEIVERKALEALEAKAIVGLAYAKTPSGDAEVLAAAQNHPSKLVRAEAIQAYLYNHGGSEQSRADLLKVLAPADRIFLDVPRRGMASDGKEFNERLTRYLQLHPELRPPQPQPKADSRPAQ